MLYLLFIKLQVSVKLATGETCGAVVDKNETVDVVPYGAVAVLGCNQLLTLFVVIVASAVPNG